MADKTKLNPAGRDKVQFSAAVEIRLTKYLGHCAKDGKSPEITPSIKVSLQYMRRMHKRFGRRDFRCSQQEIDAEQDIATWLIEAWHSLKGTRVPPNQWTNHGGDAELSGRKF